ncbi:MAG: metallophosphoesterase [Lachnospiraceae bacterium]|nr:metallophosphoesterase [Lachnospiraceae bacterium]
MGKIYITGDCHADFKKIELFCQNYETSRDDVMIILGDAGINFDLGRWDENSKRLLSHLALTFFCIHGNHEARPQSLDYYQEKMWNGGIVYFEAKYPNILFAKDGEIYELNGKKAIAIGGAYSIDKEWRLLRGAPWFDDEQPSEEIKEYVEDRLYEAKWKVDYVLSHTAPLKYEPRELFLDFIDQSKVDKSTEEWLSEIEEKLDYEKWYFGHYHGNKRLGKSEMLFEGIKELGCADFLQKVGNPMYKKGDFVSFEVCKGGRQEVLTGRISGVDAFGTFGQRKEVSYDIMGPENMLYKHIVESKVDG